jgi:hypothetical protein
MWRKWIAVAWATILGCTGCSNQVSLTFDSSVPPDQQAYIQGDLAQLNSLSIPSNPNSGDSALLDLSDFSNQSMNGWISARSKYIIGQNFDSTDNVTTLANGISYTPTLFSELGLAGLTASAGDSPSGSTRSPTGRLGDDSGLSDNSNSSNVETVMLNFGASIYLSGKQNSVIYSIQVAGTTVTDNTPRVGVVQIGPGLFDNNELSSSAPNSLANSCLRLQTLFHESAHTNGNGANAGFPHAMCNSGPYAGYYACEGNINGPYAIGRVFLTQCYYACSGCNSGDLEGITAYIADLASRMEPNAVMSDDRPEIEQQ